MSTVDLFSEVENVVNSDECCQLGEKSNWNDSSCVLRETEDGIKLFILHDMIDTFFEEDIIEGLQTGGWLSEDRVRVSLNGNRKERTAMIIPTTIPRTPMVTPSFR